MSRYTNRKQTIEQLAPYAPALMARNLPEVAPIEPDDAEVTPDGCLILNFRDLANGVTHRMGPFDPFVDDPGAVFKACVAKVHAPFN